MKISLFRVIDEERWFSQIVYADRLADGLQRILPGGWDATERSVRYRYLLPPVSLRVGKQELTARKGQLLVLRYYYGLKSRFLQGDLNHVADNSYGHLIHFMDPAKTIVTFHGGTPVTWRQWPYRGPGMKFFDWAFAGTLKAARMIAVSEYSKREITGSYDYNPDRIRVVYHGVDEQYRVLPREEREAARSRYLPAGSEYLLLHVGMCIGRKNVDPLLRAVGILSRGGLRVHLLQVGGEFSAEQEVLIEKLGIASAVTQISSLPNARLVDVYNAADVFVFPSLYEGFGIPLIEAMACGTPVVCTDCELFHEVCGDACIYADTREPQELAAAAGGVLTDALLVRKLRRQGTERAALFSWERCARETLEVYTAMAAELYG